MARVVVVGSVNRDRVVEVPSLPRPGETLTARGDRAGFGGKGANQACAAAANGTSTALVAAVGADSAGYSSIEDLESHHVDARHVVKVRAATGAADVFVDDAGENFIVIRPGANALLTGSIVDDALTNLHLTSGDVLLTSCEVPDQALEAAARNAVRAGATHLHNVAPFREMGPWSQGDHVVVIVNEVEARQATGHEDVHEAAAVLAAGRRAAVVTRGSQGALLMVGARSWEAPAPRVKVVDSTGAGDAFCGALASEVAAGSDLIRAVGAAVDAAAQVVTHAGARRRPDGPNRA